MGTEVSIIIPVFNMAICLAECLESVLHQSFKSFEVICIDDASTDDSKKILKDFEIRDPRLRVLNNRRNLGPGLSRNRGIDAAKGRFLQFVDADDLLPQNAIETLYSRAIEDAVELVRGSLAIFRDNHHTDFQNVYVVPDRRRTNLMKEESLWIPWWHTSYLISAKLIRRNQLRYPNLTRGEDPVFLASVLVNARYISLVGEITYLYRKYPKTTGSGGSTFRQVKDTLQHSVMIKRLFTEFHPDCWNRGYGPFLLKNVRNSIDRCQLDHGQRQLINSELKKIWGAEAFRN